MASADRIREFKKGRRPARFVRPFEDGWVDCFVADVAKKLVLVSRLDDGVRYDGFGVFRNKDVRKLRETPAADFVLAALRLRGLKRPKKPSIRLDDMASVLRSAGKRFPLVAIERELRDPGVVQVGRVVGVGDRDVTLRQIDPDAEWIEDEGVFRLEDITAVSFGESYLEALSLVAAAAGAE